MFMFNTTRKTHWVGAIALAGMGLVSAPKTDAAQIASKSGAPFTNLPLEEDSPESKSEDDMKDDAKQWNLPLPTMGGKQFWTDHRWWNGWRIQHNSTLDHWRLLDPNQTGPARV